MADSGTGNIKFQAVIFFLMSIVVLIAVWPASAVYTPDRSLYIINWLSHGTTLSNLLSAVTYIIAFLAFTRNKEPGRWFSHVRGAATLYMLFVLLIYPLLMMNRPFVHDGSLDWRDFVLHWADPVFMLCWWLILSPRDHISPIQSLWWLLPGVLYLVYIYVRGSYTNWYPYGFLAPAEHSGLGLAKIISAMSLVFILLAQIVAWMSRVKIGRQN